MAQLLTNKKRVLPKTEVPLESAPKYAELGLETVWEKVKGDADLMLYFPDLDQTASSTSASSSGAYCTP